MNGEDAVEYPVIINFRAGGFVQDTGNFWGWLPLNGFLNTDRVSNFTMASNLARNYQTDAGWSNYDYEEYYCAPKYYDVSTIFYLGGVFCYYGLV